jgi:hypothetical protein
MKIIFQLLILFVAPLMLFSQTQAPKYKMLDAQDPLVGEWVWVTNDSTGIAAPLPDQDWKYFKFSAGSTQSFGALLFDDATGFGCASYFIAFSDGEHITGTVSDSCEGNDKGKKFNFTYKYDAAEDLLIITVRGENFRYQRKR